MAAQGIKSAGFDECFDRGPIANLRVDALAKIKKAFEIAASVSLRSNSFCRSAATRFYRDREIRIGCVHVWRHHVDIHSNTIFQVFDQRIFVLEVAPRDIARK